MFFAGIDWADDHHDGVVLDAAGKRVGSVHVAADGLERLVAFLQGVGGEEADLEQLACIVETSHGPLIGALLEAGLPVYPVNPDTVDRQRQPSGAKTDVIDA